MNMQQRLIRMVKIVLDYQVKQTKWFRSANTVLL